MNERVSGDLPSAPIDGRSHLSVLGLLPEYVMLRVLGQERRDEWQPLEGHLAECASCRAEYDTLRQQMEATYGGALPQPDVLPAPPDLAFLSVQKGAAPLRGSAKRRPRAEPS